MSVDLQAPENLDNYLSKILESKKIIEELNSQINDLKDEKSNIASENVASLELLIKKIKEDKKNTEENLKLSKIKLAELDARSLEIDQLDKYINDKKDTHSSNVLNTEIELNNKKEELKKLSLELSAQEDINKSNSKNNYDLKGELDIREKSLNDRAAQQEELQKSLKELSEKNEQDSARNISSYEALQAQSDKLHEQIDVEKSERREDLKKMQEVANVVITERNSNEQILIQITDKTNRMQDQILNLKLLNSDLDNKKTIAIAAQEKSSEMINRLQALKDELSKEPAKIEEDSQ